MAEHFKAASVQDGVLWLPTAARTAAWQGHVRHLRTRSGLSVQCQAAPARSPHPHPHPAWPHPHVAICQPAAAAAAIRCHMINPAPAASSLAPPQPHARIFGWDRQIVSRTPPAAPGLCGIITFSSSPSHPMYHHAIIRPQRK